MSWFRHIVALVLLALWLPATSHCALETLLGWMGDDHCACVCSHDEAGQADHPASDACAIIEDGGYKPAVASLVAPAPELTILACLGRMQAALQAGARPLAPPAWSDANPDAWVPARHLARRAIAPARAPGLA